MKRATLAAVLLAASNVAAQVPGTDIYLAPFSERSGAVTIGVPVDVTARAGYDNQPWFRDGDAFWFVSADSAGATDVYRYDIPSAQVLRVTDTPESEYSPTRIPGGEEFSTVRVEHDGTQRLWRFDADGHNPRVIAPGVDSVGYHAWRDDHTVVVFIVGDPHALRIVDTIAGSETPVALDVGRALARIPGSDEVSFMAHPESGGRLFRLDSDTKMVTPLCDALPGSEDCAWTPAGTLLMARGVDVFALDPGSESTWNRVTILDGAPDGITRMAVDPSGRWIALVAEDPGE